MRRPMFLLLVCSVAISACGDDDDDFAILGVIDAGFPEAAGVDAAPPDPVTMQSASCPGSRVETAQDVANTVRAIATRDRLAVVTVDGAVRAYQLDQGANDCPGEVLASFGTDGSVAIDAAAAVALPAGRVLVAARDGMRLLDAAGSEVTSCERDGSALIVRSLHATLEGETVAALSKSPVSRLTLGNVVSACSATALTLDPAPFAIAAVANATEPGLIVVEQVSPTSPLVVARYDAGGEQVASSKAYASSTGSLCSATGLVDTPRGVFVTDSACRRVVLFEERAVGTASNELYVAGTVSFDRVPRGAALMPSEGQVLIALAEPAADSEGAPIARATYERVILP